MMGNDFVVYIMHDGTLRAAHKDSVNVGKMNVGPVIFRDLTGEGADDIMSHAPCQDVLIAIRNRWLNTWRKTTLQLEGEIETERAALRNALAHMKKTSGRVADLEQVLRGVFSLRVYLPDDLLENRHIQDVINEAGRVINLSENAEIERG
jgi:hypothetical protein